MFMMMMIIIIIIIDNNDDNDDNNDDDDSNNNNNVMFSELSLSISHMYSVERWDQSPINGYQVLCSACSN